MEYVGVDVYLSLNQPLTLHVSIINMDIFMFVCLGTLLLVKGSSPKLSMYLQMKPRILYVPIKKMGPEEWIPYQEQPNAQLLFLTHSDSNKGLWISLFIEFIEYIPDILRPSRSNRLRSTCILYLESGSACPLLPQDYARQGRQTPWEAEISPAYLQFSHYSSFLTCHYLISFLFFSTDIQ